MIQLTDSIWIGDSIDERDADLLPLEIGAILNVSNDLQSTRGWGDGVEYMQIGLVDGPGNMLAMYCAAVLGLSSLLGRYDGVLVTGHDFSRAVAVVIMYLILNTGRKSEHPSMMHRWSTWDSVLSWLREKTDIQLLDPHQAHKEACDTLPFGLLEKLL